MRGFYLQSVLSLAAATLLAVLISCSPGTTAGVSQAARKAGPAPGEVALVKAGDDGLKLAVNARGATGKVDISLHTLDGKKIADITRPAAGQMEVDLPAKINAADLSDYYLRWRVGDQAAPRQRALHFMAPVLETVVIGQRELIAGTTPVVRVMVTDKADNTPLADAPVTVTLVHDNKPLAQVKARTDAAGRVDARLALPAQALEGATLNVKVDAGPVADTVSESVTLKSPVKTLLTTDKPLYQPGQTMHIRALSLRQPTMTPLGKSPVVLEVEDAKGNKVFKHEAVTDDFGICAADFVLAHELNKGTYRVRAVIGQERQEKTVTVDRYVLPKFKLDIKTDKAFYEPGQTVKVDVQADYFFGKPVAGGKLVVKASKFDVEYQEFQAVSGTTDKSGHYQFEVKLPASFVGQPLEAGKASAKFDFALTDTADHQEKITRNVPVTAAPILVTAVPESGSLVPNLENRVYVVATYADSKPAECKVTVQAGGRALATVQTDKAGFGQFTVTPKDANQVQFQLEAADASGMRGKASVTLDATQAEGDAKVLLRTDRSIYKVGDRVKLDVISTRKAGNLYLDVIKDRQTVLTRTVDLADGKAAEQFTLDAALAGTVQINAYLFSDNGVMIRDRRLIVIDPANDLRIQVQPDADVYLPGGQARVTFTVTDPAGAGVPSALGVMVVDEAVFALQEMQPGLEKIYFYLEQEIAKPRYEIHGLDVGGIMPLPGPMPIDPLMDAGARDAAAKVLLASAQGVGDYGLNVNTVQRDGKLAAFEMKTGQMLGERYNHIQQAAHELVQKARKAGRKITAAPTLDELVKEGGLKKEHLADPWGNALTLKDAKWNSQWMGFEQMTLTSPGIDGKPGTADDVEFNPNTFWNKMAAKGGGGGRMMQLGAMADGAEMRGAVARPMAVPAGAVPLPVDPEMGAATGAPAGRGSGGGGEAAPPRIRQFFPETLYFNPAVITDRWGKASLTIPLADSITTWRLTSMASSARGALGSTTAGLRVFQDFFVDIDFPVALTQNDEVSVPVAVYNYLKTEQTVKLQVQPADWYQLRGPAEVAVTLKPDEVRAVYFPILARKVGFQNFTVFGIGSKKQDAVSRQVEIVPDGQENLLTFSGRLEGAVSHTLSIPADAIEDASKVFVKVYPGMLSQVVEGLDSMLRMPGGCFEQTSSSTYPNVLVMDYLKATNKATPEIKMKAEGFINAGYQRLVAYEVPGGGFSWFGNAPAHRILTAYGLMQFHDMSKVHHVDPNVITRTQGWLAGLQEKDGSWKNDASGIAEGAIDKMKDDAFRSTAYIAWALASTGFTGPQTAKGMRYIKDHLDELKDPYTIALTANALAAADPRDKVTLAVIRTLMNKATEEKDVIFWKAERATPTHGGGNVADIEVTALAVQALVRTGQNLPQASKAVAYLARNKDAYGNWQSTQATIQALRAMLMAERGANQEANATVVLAHNGRKLQTLTIDKSNSDVLQLVDLKEHTIVGDNKVDLTFAGEGGLLYQVVGRFYTPRTGPAAPTVGQEPLSIELAYDRTSLAAEDILGVTASVTNHQPADAKMIIVDLGLPPGFTLLPENLQKLVEGRKIEKFTVTGRQIIVYLDQLKAGETLKIQYQLLAKYPLKAKTPVSTVYEYYNPKVRKETKPVQLEVSKK